jgi:hypothetical protein
MRISTSSVRRYRGSTVYVAFDSPAPPHSRQCRFIFCRYFQRWNRKTITYRFVSLCRVWYTDIYNSCDPAVIGVRRNDPPNVVKADEDVEKEGGLGHRAAFKNGDTEGKRK